MFFQIAAEIAAPLSQAKKISMVADGSGEIGAAKLTGEVLTIMQSVPNLVKNMTGVDVTTTMPACRGGLGTRVRVFCFLVFFFFGKKSLGYLYFCALKLRSKN